MSGHRSHRVRRTVSALLFAAALTIGVSAAATASSAPPTYGAYPVLLLLLESEADAPTGPDPETEPDDEVWTSECDDDGNCQSVPGFIDPGPGAPGGPNGPRW